MSDNTFAQGVVRPALFVGGCVLLGLSLFAAVCLILALLSAILNQSFAGEILGNALADIAGYALCLVAFGAFSLALLRGSGVRWVREIPVLGNASTRALVSLGVVASLPIFLVVALIISIILGGGLD